MKEKLDFYNNLSDKASMEQAFEIYGNRLMGFINNYLKDVRLSEDIMMDIFVELLKNNPKFENEFQFRAYVFKVAKNKCINQIKRRKRLIELDEEFLQDTCELESSLFGKALDKKLNEAMSKLSYRYRQVLYLSYFEDMSISEVAQVLEISEKSATNLKHRAKLKLNKVLSKENFKFEFKGEK